MIDYLESLHRNINRSILEDYKFHFMNLEKLSKSERTEILAHVKKRLDAYYQIFPSQKFQEVVKRLLRFQWISRYRYDWNDYRDKFKEQIAKIIDRESNARNYAFGFSVNFSDPKLENDYKLALISENNFVQILSKYIFNQRKLVEEQIIFTGLDFLFEYTPFRHPSNLSSFDEWAKETDASFDEWISVIQRDINLENKRWFSSKEKIKLYEARLKIFITSRTSFKNEIKEICTDISNDIAYIRDYRKQTLSKSEWKDITEVIEAIDIKKVSLKEFLLDKGHELGMFQI